MVFHLFRVFTFITLFSLSACIHLGPIPSIEEPPPPAKISYEFYKDGEIVTIHISQDTGAVREMGDTLLATYSKNIRYEDYFSSIENDSIRLVLTQKLKNRVELDSIPLYAFRNLESTEGSITIELEEDFSRIAILASELMKRVENSREESPVSTPLIHDNFSYLSDLSLLLPCPNVPVPEQANLLPNAPRPYRSGIHRGIDFPAIYGTEVRNVADGIVIRADHGYREVTDEFRESLLQKTSQLGHTPSDVFEFILLGRSVFIDHGVEIIPGKRLVSVHAHLSHIEDSIQVGETVKRGQRLGLCGNSGTGDGARGSQAGAHLHFEFIIQDDTGETYMGQGLPYPELVDLLTTVFVQE